MAMIATMLAAAAWLAVAAADDPLSRFWRENDGKTVRRLPVDVLPENAFWGFITRDFPDGMKAIRYPIADTPAAVHTMSDSLSATG